MTLIVTEVVSAFIALIAIIIAARAVRESSRDAKLQIQVTNLREYSKLYFDLFSGKSDFLSTPSNYDKEEFKEFLERYFGMCYQEYTLDRLGLLNKDVWKAWTEKIKQNVHKPEFKEGWKALNKDHRFCIGFREFIDLLIKDQEYK